MARQLDAQAAPGEMGELGLLVLVRGPQLGGRDAIDVLPPAAHRRCRIEVVEVRSEMALEQFADRSPDPGRGVDAVGQAEDLVRDDVLPGGIGGLGVEQAHGVRAAREPEAEGGHVELARVPVGAPADLEHPIHRNATGAGPSVSVEQRPGDLADQRRVEAFVAGGDRRVDREDAVPTVLGEGLVERRARGDALAGSLGEQERGVALVQVPDGGVDAERPDRADTADPQHELLMQAHLPATDVQDVGDRPVGSMVLGVVGVQQQHRDPTDLHRPDVDTYVPPGQFDGHRQGIACSVEGPGQWQAGQVVVRVGVFLMPVRIDRLAEIPAAVQEPDADERQRHVARRLHVVAGEDPQAA